jgi:dipeptidyl aminopeptidase/acylaminoacyl peptidase
MVADGKLLAFLSSRDANQQVYLLSMSGGEPAPLTKGKRSINHFAWSPDSQAISFLAPDGKTEAEEKKEKDKDDAHVADKEDKHARLWLINLQDKSEHALTPANFSVSDQAWFPDGNSLAIIATDHPESDRNTERIFLVSTSGSDTSAAMKQLLAPRGPFRDLDISPAGNTVSFIGSREDGPSPHDLWLLPLGMPAAKNLTASNLDRTVFGYRWNKDGSLVLLAADGFTRKLIRFSPSGVREDLALPEIMPSSFALSSNGSMACAAESATEPQELWLAAAGQSPKKFPNFNQSFDAFSVAKPEIYKYKSFDGLEIEAALLKPAGSDGKSRLPLIALIHGGPTGAWESSIEPWGQLLVARGYAVFYSNIRGSVGYGEKFLESNRADWGGSDFKDVSCVDDLIAKGIANPDRPIGGCLRWLHGGMGDHQTTVSPRSPPVWPISVEYGTEQHPS